MSLHVQLRGNKTCDLEEVHSVDSDVNISDVYVSKAHVTKNSKHRHAPQLKIARRRKYSKASNGALYAIWAPDPGPDPGK